MIQLGEGRERMALSHVHTLQETDTHRVELVRGSTGQRFVLKAYKTSSRFSDIERSLLQSLSQTQFKYLRIPKLVAVGDRCIVTSFVERAHYTRETILQHVWTKEDVSLFCAALREFQSLSVDPALFTAKQKAMGLVYPVVRLALTLPNALRNRALSLTNVPQLLLMVLSYLLSRLSFRNVLTHYDLTTLNYTFAPDSQMSMLDFEFAYYAGDPMFDAIYYVTIPAIPLSEWTFQKEIVFQQVRQAGGSYWSWNRARLILAVCLLSRYLFFSGDPKKQSVVRDSLRTVLSSRRFCAWKRDVTSGRSEKFRRDENCPAAHQK